MQPHWPCQYCLCLWFLSSLRTQPTLSVLHSPQGLVMVPVLQSLFNEQLCGSLKVPLFRTTRIGLHVMPRYPKVYTITPYVLSSPKHATNRLERLLRGLRMLAALLKNPCSGPGTHVRWLTIVHHSGSRDLKPFELREHLYEHGTHKLTQAHMSTHNKINKWIFITLQTYTTNTYAHSGYPGWLTGGFLLVSICQVTKHFHGLLCHSDFSTKRCCFGGFSPFLPTTLKSLSLWIITIER